MPTWRQATASPRPSLSRSDTSTDSGVVDISVVVDNVDDVRVVSTDDVDVDSEIEEERVNVRVLSSVVDIDFVTSEEDNADAVTALGSDKVSPECSSLKIEKVLSSSSEVGL